MDQFVPFAFHILLKKMTECLQCPADVFRIILHIEDRQFIQAADDDSEQVMYWPA